MTRLVFLSHRPPIEMDRTAPGAQAQDEHPGGDLRVAIRGVRVRDVRAFQAGFGNQVLWPLCHVFPGQCSFHPGLWTAFRRANEAFSDAARAVLAPGDAVWV